MLKLYTNIELVNDKEYVAVPWAKYFRQNKITKYFDDTDTTTVSNVEGTSLINNETIQGKFSDMPIGIGCLSEGCKTLLCINHAIKTNTIKNYVFNITSCGGNAISYLAEVIASEIDVYAYSGHSDFGCSSTINMQINNGNVYTDALCASEEYVKLKGGFNHETY